MLTYSGCGIGVADAENGSPAGSLLSGEGELPEEAGDSPGTSRDTEEEATLSDEFYSHDTDDEEDQSKRRRDRSNSVSEIKNLSLPNYKISKFPYYIKYNKFYRDLSKSVEYRKNSCWISDDLMKFIIIWYS